MGSVATESRRNVDLAPLATGAAYGRGLRALALAPRWVGRGWRRLVESVGQQTYYLVGPSPWMLRDLGRGQARDEGGDPPAGIDPVVPGSPEPGWPGGVEVIRLNGSRRREPAGVR